MKRRVLIAHRSSYPNPISFNERQRVETGVTDDEFPGWIRVRLADGNEGWAPQEFLLPQGDGSALTIEDYDARELDTEFGEELELRRELNGWFWARNRSGAEGWVPMKTTEPIPV